MHLLFQQTQPVNLKFTGCVCFNKIVLPKKIQQILLLQKKEYQE